MSDYVTDEMVEAAARAEMRRVLENQFGPFLARDPHDPERFWGLAVDAVMEAAARAETTADLHWSNAAAAEYPGDEYEQYPLRTAFGRGVKWERKRAARNGIEQ